MITENKIVFVLGAGASVPYGFPTGQQLREQLCRELPFNHPQLSLNMEQVGFGKEARETFALEFLHSGIASIDAFIARRPEHRAIAEHAIACALLPCEQIGALNSTGQDKNGERVSGRGNWYQYLWQIMIDHVEKPEQISECPVSFVTFNYDRSLEVFFHNALVNGFGASQEEAAKVVSALRIHHVYGSLGEYDEKLGYQYGVLNAETVKRAVCAIKTIPLNRPEVDQDAMSMIVRGKVILYLGFGFDGMNCRRLNLAEASRKVAEPHYQMFYTSFNLTKEEQRRVQFNSQVETPLNEFAPVEGDCLNLLREKVMLLR